MNMQRLNSSWIDPRPDDTFFDEWESEITTINKESDLISFIDAMIYYDELDPKKDFKSFYDVVFSLMWGLKGTAGFKVETGVDDMGAYLYILLKFTEETPPKWSKSDAYSYYTLHLDEFMELMVEQGRHPTGYSDLFSGFPKIRSDILDSSEVAVGSK